MRPSNAKSVNGNINVFYNYDVHILRPQNTKSGEPYIENIGDKFKLVLHNDISNERWDQITDMIHKCYPPSSEIVRQCHLGTLKPSYFLGR